MWCFEISNFSCLFSRTIIFSIPFLLHLWGQTSKSPRIPFFAAFIHFHWSSTLEASLQLLCASIHAPISSSVFFRIFTSSYKGILFCRSFAAPRMSLISPLLIFFNCFFLPTFETPELSESRPQTTLIKGISSADLFSLVFFVSSHSMNRKAIIWQHEK